MLDFELICVGDELLEGRIVDQNTATLGNLLLGTDAKLVRVEIVPDRIDDICAALERTKSAHVIVSGGLGPTEDDITREAAATFLGVELHRDEETVVRIADRFASRGYTFTANNERQATFPDGAVVLRTEVGTAPGFRCERDGRTFYFFPGVPREFTWYCERTIAPLLGDDGGSARSLYFHGIGESTLETKIASSMRAARRHGVTVGFRASYPIIELKLVGPADAVASARDEAASLLRPWLVAEDDESLPARLGRLLLDRGATLTTAESCTAGGIAAAITDVSGSSAWFQRGFISYSNEAKNDLLDVAPDVLLHYGAVSAQTVAQMASGARRAARSTLAVAVSGIAGPGGGTQQKPVGTVHFGLATPDGVYHRHVHFRLPDRAAIRAGTVYTALAFVLWYLEERLDEHSVTGPYSEEEVWSSTGIPVEQSTEHGVPTADVP